MKHSGDEWVGGLHKRLRIISYITGCGFYFIWNDLPLQATLWIFLSQQPWKTITNHLVIFRKPLFGINIVPFIQSQRLTLSLIVWFCSKSNFTLTLWHCSGTPLECVPLFHSQTIFSTGACLATSSLNNFITFQNMLLCPFCPLHLLCIRNVPHISIHYVKPTLFSFLY